MKRITLIGCLLIGLSSSLFSQKTAEESKIILPDSVMEQVIKRIVTWYFKAPKKPKTIYFAAQNIKKEWLPTISNLEFVILEKHPPDGYEHKVYFFRDLEMQHGAFLIPFGYGDPDCDSVGDTWAFRLNGSRVKQLEQAWIGWGAGCSAASGSGS